MSQTKTLYLNDRIAKASGELLIALGGSALLMLLSQISIPLPFTPIPLTLQTFAVFLLAGILGSRRAVYSVIAYLIQGSLGLPVFAGGIIQPLWLMDPKAGFLLSFIPAAYLIGKLLERRPQSPIVYKLMALTVGQFAISGIGMLWLSASMGCSRAFILGVLPFMSGAAIKIAAGALSLTGFSLCKKN